MPANAFMLYLESRVYNIGEVSQYPSKVRFKGKCMEEESI